MNKYDILSVVGEGAQGIVQKAKHKETNEIVAIKKFKDDCEEDDLIRKTALREVKMLKVARHENIIRMKEAFRRKNKLHLVFEQMDRTLLEVLEEQAQGIDTATLRRQVFQLLKAIDYCHRSDIIHRDIKPENILINSEHTLKICDFGFARSTAKPPEQTEYVATRWQRAPELLLGQPYGKPCDVWAIGCLMGEMVDTQPLFPGESEVDQLQVIHNMLGPFPASLKAVIERRRDYRTLKLRDKMRNGLEMRYKSKLSAAGVDFLKKCLEYDQTKRWSVAKLLTHEFILEDSGLTQALDKVDMIRNNALNYNQDMIKKIRKSTKDLVDSSPDSLGPSKGAKNSPKQLNLKDNMFRTLRTSQQVKRKDHSQENDKEVRNSVGSKASLRQTFHKEKPGEVKSKVVKQPPQEGLYDRDTNQSISQSPRGHQLPKTNSKSNLNNQVGTRNTPSRDAKSRSNSRNTLKHNNNKQSTNDIHQQVENAQLYELLDQQRGKPTQQSNMQLPIIAESKGASHSNHNTHANPNLNINSVSNTNATNNSNVNFNNWFRMESRTNLSGFLEDSELARKNHNGLFKKMNEDNRYFQDIK